MKDVLSILKSIEYESSINNKINIIKRNKNNELFHKVLILALTYYKTYNVTELTYKPNDETTEDELISYLEEISSSDKRGMTNEEIDYLSKLASISPEAFEVTNRIITKNLKCGASIKTFKKVFPDIETFELMTCISDINKFKKRYEKDKETSYYWSIKKDGVRCLVSLNNDTLEYISRSGRCYLNFSQLDDDIKNLIRLIKEKLNTAIDISIDGEIISTDGNYDETMRHVRTDNDESNYNYYVFDFTTKTINSKLNLPLSRRQEILDLIFNEHNFNNLIQVKHNKISSEIVDINKLNQIMTEVTNNGDEGIVVKMGSSPYVFKEKSIHWCKMKPYETLDLLVLNKFYGKSGTKFDGLIGGFIVKYKDRRVRVGSGLSDEDRIRFLHETPRIIEVRCKGETPLGSLPTSTVKPLPSGRGCKVCCR